MLQLVLCVIEPNQVDIKAILFASVMLCLSIRAVGDCIVMYHEVSCRMMMTQPLYKLVHQKSIES